MKSACSFCYGKGHKVVDSDGTDVLCTQCDAWKTVPTPDKHKHIAISDIPNVDNKVSRHVYDQVKADLDEAHAALARQSELRRKREEEMLGRAYAVERERDEARAQSERYRSMVEQLQTDVDNASSTVSKTRRDADRRVAELHAKLERIARGNRHPGGETMTAMEMMRIARAVLLDAPAALSSSPAQPAKEHCPRRLMGETLAPHAPCDTGDHSKDVAPAQPATAAKSVCDCPEYVRECLPDCPTVAAPPSPAATKLQPLIVPDKTEEMVARLGAEVEHEYEARRLAGEMCRAIEVTGEKCTATIERGALWCDLHRGITPAVISSNRDMEAEAIERVINLASQLNCCAGEDAERTPEMQEALENLTRIRAATTMEPK